MTPQQIADISDPIEQIYSDMTDELLLNIAKHLNSSTWTWTALGEIETLETMGQLTEENVRIINGYVQKIPQAVKDAMNDSRLQALSEIEDKLESAALNGHLTPPVTDGTVEVAQAFSAQAISQLNLVNQTMLNSSLDAYQQGMRTMRQGMTTIQDDDELREAQNIIDIAAGKTVLGTETRTTALRTALKQLNYNGITGFFDRLGRSWSAEAYVNMDIRTTVHNTYIQSVKTRQEDYGSDVFQVSAHAGARPLCYPYQGKLYSWGNSGGYITLGDGKRYRFESIKETSYGEPAGLFGINCGHVPYPMIPAVSEKVDEPIQSKAENDREYQESQQQRSLERQIRYYKRELEMLGPNATEADRQRARAAQAKMREFIKDTGRTRRYDREQIVTEGMSLNPMRINNRIEVKNYPSDKISSGMKAKLDNTLETARKRYRSFDIVAVEPMTDKEMAAFGDKSAAYVNAKDKTLRYNPALFSDTKKMEQAIGEAVSNQVIAKVDKKYYSVYASVHESKHGAFSVRYNLPRKDISEENMTYMQKTATEIRDIYNRYLDAVAKAEASRNSAKQKMLENPTEENTRALIRADEEYQKVFISKRARKNVDEFLAEAATEADIGSNISPYSVELAKKLDERLGALP